MKATSLLTQQHQEVSRLFKAIESAESATDKRPLFRELASLLTSHDAIERQLFYPAFQDAMGLDDELGEALVEHGVIEFCLYQANEALGKPDFDFKCKVLKEIVEHHVKEEQDEFFPHAEKALGDEMMEALGEEMEEAFEEARSEDFQEPLYENLRQVFAGVLEPVPAKTKSEPRRKSA
jgi:hemerythrin-like domain-containing protein